MPAYPANIWSSVKRIREDPGLPACPAIQGNPPTRSLDGYCPCRNWDKKCSLGRSGENAQARYLPPQARYRCLPSGQDFCPKRHHQKRRRARSSPSDKAHWRESCKYRIFFPADTEESDTAAPGYLAAYTFCPTWPLRADQMVPAQLRYPRRHALLGHKACRG